MKTFDHIFQANGRAEFLIIAGIALIMITLLLLRTELLTFADPTFDNPWDHHKYLYMATENPFDFHIAPFCWRIGTPLLAKIFPFSMSWNFLLISFISIWMTGVSMYYIAKECQFSRGLAVVGMLMFFSLGWAARSALRNFWLPDALTSLFIALTLYAIFAKRDRWLVILLTIGVTVKESVLFTIPLYYTFNARKIVDMKFAKRIFLLAIPVVVMLVGLRIGIPNRNDDPDYLRMLPDTLKFVQRESSSYTYRTLFKEIGIQRIREISFHTLQVYTVGTFGVMVMLLPFFALRQNLPLAGKSFPFLVLVYAQLCFAVNTQRLLVIGFPVMILLALNGLKTIVTVLDIKPIAFLGLPLLLIGLNVLRVNSVFASFDMQAVVFILYFACLFQPRLWRK